MIWGLAMLRMMGFGLKIRDRLSILSRDQEIAVEVPQGASPDLAIAIHVEGMNLGIHPNSH